MLINLGSGDVFVGAQGVRAVSQAALAPACWRGTPLVAALSLQRPPVGVVRTCVHTAHRTVQLQTVQRLMDNTVITPLLPHYHISITS